MNRKLRDFLLILVSLADDIAVTLIILLILWLIKGPITLPVIIFIVVFFIAFTLIMHKLVIPAYYRRKVCGREGLIGMEGEARELLNPTGQIKIKGEIWKAKSIEGEIKKGEKVEVVGIEGLSLKVKRKEAVK